MCAAGLQLEHRIWADLWLSVCQSWIECPVRWSALVEAPRHHLCSLTKQKNSTRLRDIREYSIAWSKTHQDSNSTQEHCSISAICARETQSSSGVEIALQTHRVFKQQPVTIGLTKASDKQITKGKCRNVTNRNQGNMAASKPNSLTTGIPGLPNIPEKQDLDLKSLVMLLLEEHKDINKSLKDIQE